MGLATDGVAGVLVGEEGGWEGAEGFDVEGGVLDLLEEAKLFCGFVSALIDENESAAGFEEVEQVLKETLGLKGGIGQAPGQAGFHKDKGEKAGNDVPLLGGGGFGVGQDVSHQVVGSGKGGGVGSGIVGAGVEVDIHPISVQLDAGEGKVGGVVGEKMVQRRNIGPVFRAHV